MFRLPAVLLAAYLLPSAADAAEQWQSAPPGGTGLLPAGDAADVLEFSAFGGGAANRTEVAADGLPVEKAVRVAVAGPAEPVYAVQLKAELTGDVAAGDVLLVTSFLRGAAADGGPARAKAYLQQNGGDYNDGQYASSAVLDLKIDAEWTQHFLPVVAPRDQPAGTSHFTFHLAYAEQAVEVAGLQILNYGPDVARESLPRTRTTYPGREPNSAWRAEAAAAIDAHRKADLTVRVVDGNGDPRPGATVRVAMTRHAFGFGTAVDAWLLAITREEYDALPAERREAYSWEDVLKYRDVVGHNFNKAVLENDLKIGGWLAGAGNNSSTFRREWNDRALAWLAERDIEVRGHYGVWGPVAAGDSWNTGTFDVTQPGYDRYLIEHLRDEVPAVGDRVAEWDAVNHIVGWGETLLGRYGPAFYAEVLAEMRSLAPHAELWVNEGNIVSDGGQIEPYLQVIRDLVELGQRPDGAGFMAHFRDGSLMPPAEIGPLYDRFAELVPKLQLTELDYETLDRGLQADYFRDVLTVSFAHPAMDGVVQWGFWESRHWRPDAALWTADWNLRPVGVAYRDLVFGDWWTDATVRTGPDGTATVRGFRGAYRVTVTDAGVSRAVAVTLGAGGVNREVVLP